MKTNMTKKQIFQELRLLQMNVHAAKDEICSTLDTLLDRISRILPAEDKTRYQRYKNFTKKDWQKSLDF